MKKIMACNEKIVYDISEVVKRELRIQLSDCEEFGDPSLLSDDLVECNELCEKILSFNYFSRSEKCLNEGVKALRRNNSLKCSLLKYKWLILYKLDLYNKKKDLRRLFKLIVNSSEDWC